MEKQFQDILNKEGVIRNEPASWVQSDERSIHGRLILTSKRLFFARSSVNTSAFTRYMIHEQNLEPLVEIDLDTITKVAQEKIIVDDQILSVTYMQYDNAKFSVLSYEEWEKDIQLTRMTPDIPGDPNIRQEAA
jgi:hypothetical protein